MGPIYLPFCNDTFIDFCFLILFLDKYICKLIREKKYTPQSPKPQKQKKISLCLFGDIFDFFKNHQTNSVESSSSSESGSDSESDGYLHPVINLKKWI